MPDQSGAVVADQAAVCSAAAELNELAQRIERGGMPAIADFSRVIQAKNRITRAHAKRLLSHVMLKHAQRDAANLMVEACEDLSFRQPVVLQEAVQSIQSLHQPRQLINFCLRAAEQLSENHRLIPALVYLQNALVTDIGNGSDGVNNPEFVRRIVAVYEPLAEQCANDYGITPPPHAIRRSPSGRPLRMAHVVAQLVDGGHAPSRSIETMLKLADRERFESYLCVTESLAVHQQHAGQIMSSGLSKQRAPNRINRFEKELGIPVLLPRTRASFVAAAADLHKQFAELEIDIAFFHGSLATPTEWLMCAWQSAPWQADAGFGVPLHCPRVDYQFFEFEQSMEALAFLCRERGIAYGLKKAGADMSHVEGAVAFSREQLRIPADHVILGTVGNHLPERMSERFCATVGRVMRKYPQTTLLAVGPGNFARQRQVFGAELCDGAAARVRFVGHQDEPARLTKAFDIYLNSFPDGGGFVLGDAMAASRSVVAMVAGDSTYAQAGASWLGEEYLVTPATDEAYAERVGELIEHPEQRDQFGRQMRQQYEQRHDARRWVNHMNDRILEIIEAGPKKQAMK